MHRRIGFFIKCIIFILLLVIGFIATGNLVMRKASLQKDGDFYKLSDSVDVLFFGSSHMLNGVMPRELWREYGISSYNLAHDSEYLPGDYYDLLNALQYSSPKVVVVDVFLLELDSKIGRDESGSLSYAHKFFDSMPFSNIKVKAAMDLLEDNKERAELLFPVSLYHTRWNQLEETDFTLESTYELGAQGRFGVANANTPEIIDRENKTVVNSVERKYLQKVIDCCKEKGIQLLLLNLPYAAPDSYQAVANGVYDIAKENQVDYLNLLHEETGVNYDIDLYDSGHLNPSGAKKADKFIGKYLKENYDLKDHREDPSYSDWEDGYQNYITKKAEWFQENHELIPYLVMLNDADYSSVVLMNGTSGFASYGKIQEALNTLGIDVDWDEIVEGKQDFLTIHDSKTEENTVYSEGETSTETETSFGKVTYMKAAGGEQSITINDTVLTANSNYGYLLAAVIDNRNGKVVDSIRLYDNGIILDE